MLPRIRANVAASKQGKLCRMWWLCTYLPYNFRCNHPTFTFPLWSTGSVAGAVCKGTYWLQTASKPFPCFTPKYKVGLLLSSPSEYLLIDIMQTFTWLCIFIQTRIMWKSEYIFRRWEEFFFLNLCDVLTRKRHVQKINEAQIWIQLLNSFSRLRHTSFGIIFAWVPFCDRKV